MNYCADCEHFDLRERTEARAGLGKCKAEGSKAGHYKSAGCPRNCARFKQADAATINERARLLGE